MSKYLSFPGLQSAGQSLPRGAGHLPGESGGGLPTPDAKVKLTHAQ